MKKTITLSTQLKVQIDEHTTGRDILLMDVYSRCVNNVPSEFGKDTFSDDIPNELTKEIEDILSNEKEFDKVKVSAICAFKDNFGLSIRIEFPNRVKHQLIVRSPGAFDGDYPITFCDNETLFELNCLDYKRFKNRT